MRVPQQCPSLNYSTVSFIRTVWTVVVGGSFSRTILNSSTNLLESALSFIRIDRSIAAGGTSDYFFLSHL